MATVNNEMYIDIFRRLRDAVKRKSPEKWRTNSWFLLHDNVPTHQQVVIKDSSEDNNVTTLQHPPYSPNLAAADFYLFPRLKLALKGCSLCDAIDISENREKS
jgi:histone-lysine N-methyltransferase SETMAR